jgi:hypothetical protein
VKTIVNIAVLAAVLLVMTPGPCLAAWDIELVTKDRAKELGLEIRSAVVSPNQVQVELQFKAEGELKNFSHVELRFSKRTVTAPLREDRSKPGRFVVSVTVDRIHLGNLNLWVRVPGTLGGAVYDLRVKDFVESKANR